MIGSLWEQELARKPAAFSTVHKPATNRVNLVASQHWHHQNLTNLPTPHFEKLELARGMKSTGSECVLWKRVLFKLSKTMGSEDLNEQIVSFLYERQIKCFKFYKMKVANIIFFKSNGLCTSATIDRFHDRPHLIQNGLTLYLEAF